MLPIAIAHVDRYTVYACGMTEYPQLLYRFRYRDPLTGKWRTARYRATEEEIRSRHPDFELYGEPMVIRRPTTGTFNPFRRIEGEG